mgnify:CR=1 FL=1
MVVSLSELNILSSVWRILRSTDAVPSNHYHRRRNVEEFLTCVFLLTIPVEARLLRSKIDLDSRIPHRDNLQKVEEVANLDLRSLLRRIFALKLTLRLTVAQLLGYAPTKSR